MEDGKTHKVIAGGVISKETLWSCTTCMSCVEACPVGIEHLTSIVQNGRKTLILKLRMYARKKQRFYGLWEIMLPTMPEYRDYHAK